MVSFFINVTARHNFEHPRSSNIQKREGMNRKSQKRPSKLSQEGDEVEVGMRRIKKGRLPELREEKAPDPDLDETDSAAPSHELENGHEREHEPDSAATQDNEPASAAAEGEADGDQDVDADASSVADPDAADPESTPPLTQPSKPSKQPQKNLSASPTKKDLKQDHQDHVKRMMTQALEKKQSKKGIVPRVPLVPPAPAHAGQESESEEESKNLDAMQATLDDIKANTSASDLNFQLPDSKQQPDAAAASAAAAGAIPPATQASYSVPARQSNGEDAKKPLDSQAAASSVPRPLPSAGMTEEEKIAKYGINSQICDDEMYHGNIDLKDVDFTLDLKGSVGKERVQAIVNYCGVPQKDGLPVLSNIAPTKWNNLSLLATMTLINHPFENKLINKTWDNKPTGPQRNNPRSHEYRSTFTSEVKEKELKSTIPGTNRFYDRESKGYLEKQFKFVVKSTSQCVADLWFRERKAGRLKDWPKAVASDLIAAWEELQLAKSNGEIKDTPAVRADLTRYVLRQADFGFYVGKAGALYDDSADQQSSATSSKKDFYKEAETALKETPSMICHKFTLKQYQEIKRGFPAATPETLANPALKDMYEGKDPSTNGVPYQFSPPPLFDLKNRLPLHPDDYNIPDGSMIARQSGWTVQFEAKKIRFVHVIGTTRLLVERLGNGQRSRALPQVKVLPVAKYQEGQFDPVQRITSSVDMGNYMRFAIDNINASAIPAPAAAAPPHGQQALPAPAGRPMLDYRKA